MDEEFFVGFLIEQNISDQPGVNTLVVAHHVEQGDRAADFFHGHVLEAVPGPNCTSGDDCGSKPAHDIRVHEVTRFNEVKHAQDHHRSAAHDLDPVVEVRFVIKDGKSFFDHGVSVVAHGRTMSRWDF